MMPTADDVATVIVAAARIMGADPIAVATYRGNSPGDDKALVISRNRARAYAAMAIYHVYDIERRSAARLAGVPAENAMNYLAPSQHKPRLYWWDEKTFKRVCDAAPRRSSPPAIRTPPAMPVASKPATDMRPSLSPRTGLDRFAQKYPANSFEASMTRKATEKADLSAILREAVENTARMQTPEEE